MESRKRFLCNRLGRDEVLNHLKEETPSAIFKFKYLTSDELRLSLIEKVIEEASEVFEDQNNDENLKKEICDVLEAVDCLRNILGFSKEEIEVARKLKIEQRGAFHSGLFIYWVEILKNPTARNYEYVMAQSDKYPAEEIQDKSKMRFWYSKNGKLVRDNAILSLQKECPEAVFNYKILNKKERLSALFDKLQEEALELFEEREDKNELKNEIADVLEVVEAISELKNFSAIEIKEIGDEKRNKFGSFNKGLFVEWFEVPIGSRMYEYALLNPEKYKSIMIEA